MSLVCDDDMLFVDRIDMSDSVGDGKLFSGLDGEVIGLYVLLYKFCCFGSVL